MDLSLGIVLEQNYIQTIISLKSKSSLTNQTKFGLWFKLIYNHSMKSQDPHQEHLQSIINLYTEGQLQQALSESSQMLERFPNSVILYNIAGASNAALMQFDAAIESYKQALRIKPDYADAYYNMGVALNDKGDPEAAIESYKQALRIKPDYAKAYNNMGVALNDKGDPEAAIESYKQALRIKPDYADAYNNMGSALKDKGDLEEAIDSYKQALRIKPDYAEGHSNLGDALQLLNQTEPALASYEKAISLKKDLNTAISGLGMALLKKGEHSEGLDKLRQGDGSILFNIKSGLSIK